MQNEFKSVTVGGRNFTVRKFTAQTGSFIAVKVAGLLAPAFETLTASLTKTKGEQEVNITKALAPMLGALTNLTEADFGYIQNKSLNVCYEVLPGKEVRVLNEDNTFGVIGLEEDAATCMALTVHALIFNLSSFFLEGPLASILGELPATK